MLRKYDLGNNFRTERKCLKIPGGNDGRDLEERREKRERGKMKYKQDQFLSVSHIDRAATVMDCDQAACSSVPLILPLFVKMTGINFQILRLWRNRQG